MKLTYADTDAATSGAVAKATDGDARAPRITQRAKPLLVIGVAAVGATLLQMKFPFITGPKYYIWAYQYIEPLMVFPVMFAAALPVLIAVWGYERRWWGWKPGMALVMAGVIALLLCASLIQPKVGGWERAVRLIRSPGGSSYCADALRLHDSGMPVREWMRRYPELMPDMYVHSQVRPPGLVLFHTFFFKVFGRAWVVTYGVALLLAGLVALSVLGTFVMIRAITGDEEAGFFAAAFMAMCPGLVLFFPAMDGVYPIATCAVGWLCFQMVRTQRLRYAVALGAVLAVVTMCTYALLVLGVLVVGSALLGLWEGKGWTWKVMAKHWAAVLGTVAGLYGVLWLVSGFDPIATFRTALRMQQEILRWVRERPYPDTVLFDQTDFALGSGWISVVLLAFALWGLARRRDPRLKWVILCLAQIEVVAAAALMPAETARLWCFLLPLLLLPIGLELKRWDAGAKMAVYVSLWVMLAVICGRLEFVATEPLDKLPAYLLEGR